MRARATLLVELIAADEIEEANSGDRADMYRQQ